MLKSTCKAGDTHTFARGLRSSLAETPLSCASANLAGFHAKKSQATGKALEAPVQSDVSREASSRHHPAHPRIEARVSGGLAESQGFDSTCIKARKLHQAVHLPKHARSSAAKRTDQILPEGAVALSTCGDGGSIAPFHDERASHQIAAHCTGQIKNTSSQP